VDEGDEVYGVEVSDTIHVVPGNDQFVHEASPFCACEPRLTDDDQLTDPDEDGERYICVSYQHQAVNPS
jgi:hypothetical protein